MTQLTPSENIIANAKVWEDPQELHLALEEAKVYFSDELTKIDPSYPWEFPGEVYQSFSYSSSASFYFKDTISYTKDACDLVHPNTYINTTQAVLPLRFITTVNGIETTFHLTITSDLTEEDKLTLRQCGALYEVEEVTERKVSRTSVVSCKVDPSIPF